MLRYNNNDNNDNNNDNPVLQNTVSISGYEMHSGMLVSGNMDCVRGISAIIRVDHS